MIYYTTPDKAYLESVGDFITSRYKGNIHNLRIIVPSSIVAQSLQKILVYKALGQALLLPNIIPLAALTTESRVLHKLPQQNIAIVSYLEQKLIMTKIIQEYAGSAAFSCNILQAEHLSQGLIKLFGEMSDAEIDILDLQYIVDSDSASHWIESSHFLCYTFTEYRSYLEANNKIDPSEMQKLILDIELESIQELDTIIVGIVPNNSAMKRFVKTIMESQNGVVILPPFILNDCSTAAHSPFYHIKHFLDFCKTDDNIIHSLALNNERDVQDPKVQYITASTLLEEAEVIARIVMHESAGTNNIAIVTNNTLLRHLCEISLNKYGLQGLNLCYETLIATKEAECVLLIAETALFYTVDKLTALLKTPYMECDMAREFEMACLRDNARLDQLEIEDDVLRDWFLSLMHKMHSLRELHGPSVSFKKILKIHVECVSRIAPQVWISDHISTFFRELLGSVSNAQKIELELYPALLRQFLADAKYLSRNDSHISFLSPCDASLLDIDTVIIADCNDGSLPTPSFQSPWVNNKMRKILGLVGEAEQIGISHYHFYLLTHKANVYITRSTKIDSRVTTPSRFLVDLQLTLETYINTTDAIKPRYNWFVDIPYCSGRIAWNLGLKQVPFPTTISVTDIEMLIRNPYGFYAKKILGLRAVDKINKPTSFADFGTLIHNIIGLYTQNYDAAMASGYKCLYDIGLREFSKFSTTNKYNAWWDKFLVIAEDFIKFDEDRRHISEEVYAEIYGEMLFHVADRTIKVTGIADRIEVLKDGSLCILDYKTGKVPSKQEVMQGVAPQLIVEALIALSGGFKGIKPTEHIKLIYVKLSSTSNMMQTQVAIDLSTEDLMRHKDGLSHLLEYYIKEGQEFLAYPNQAIVPRYNDYMHLARKLIL
jgi:ATP-dependent helicase/nuclease subunit B